MKLGFIGYGDAGKAVADGLFHDEGVTDLFAWTRSSVPCDTPDENGVRMAASMEDLICTCDVLFVMVPGAAAIETAQKAAAYLNTEKFYIDLTTSSPHDMNVVSRIILASGARFSDGAMMDTVPKYRHKVPTTLCGKDGEAAAEIMGKMGMVVDFLGTEPGKADAVKLLRSMYTKAHLACAFEMLEAAEHYGVAEYVMDGLAKTMDAKTFVSGMDGRTAGGVIHAARRSHELLSAAEMLEADGLDAVVTRAGAEKLRRIGELDIKNHLTYGKPKTWQEAMRYVKERKEAEE